VGGRIPVGGVDRWTRALRRDVAVGLLGEAKVGVQVS